MQPLEDVGLEVIYSLAAAAQGRGYATEAARAVVQYALGPLGLPPVPAEIDEGNVASTWLAVGDRARTVARRDQLTCAQVLRLTAAQADTSLMPNSAAS